MVAGSLPLLGLGNQSEDLTHEDAVCDQMLQTQRSKADLLMASKMGSFYPGF